MFCIVFAEESRDQLLDELKALQTLTALDTRAYEETIAEMKGALAALKGQIQPLDPNEGVGADESAASDAAAAEQKLSYRQLEEARLSLGTDPILAHSAHN